ncbi:O-antigen ligase family protein [Deltaproteobacteria bacterium TL4]
MSLPPLLSSSSGWNKIFIYSLFATSTFSIAGADTAIVGLYLVFLMQWGRGQFQWKSWNPVLIATLIFVGINGFSGFMTPNVGLWTGIHSNWRILLPFMFLLGLEDTKVDSLLQVFFVFLVFMSLYGMIQYFTGADWFHLPENQSAKPYKHPCFPVDGYANVFHAKGNFANHLTFGGVLLLSFPFLASLSLCKTLPVWKRVTYTLGTTLVLGAIAASLARSVWIGSLVALGVLFFSVSKKLFAFLSVLSLLVLSLFIYYFTLHSPQLSHESSNSSLMWERLKSTFVLKYNQDRLLMWQSAIDAIEDHPWLGIGIRADSDTMPYYRRPISRRTGHDFYNAASAGVHNIYLQTWLNLGIIGLLSYLSILVTLSIQIALALRSSPAHSFSASLLWGSLAGISGFAVAGFFENNFRDGEVQTMLCMSIGLALYAMKNNAVSSRH